MRGRHRGRGRPGTGELAGLISPSLFSSSSALVLTELENLPEPAQDELTAYAASPSPDVAVVLVHSGGQKGKKLLDQLRGQSSVTEVKVEAPKYEREFVAWVRTELRDLGATIDEEAASTAGRLGRSGPPGARRCRRPARVDDRQGRRRHGRGGAPLLRRPRRRPRASRSPTRRSTDASTSPSSRPGGPRPPGSRRCSSRVRSRAACARSPSWPTPRAGCPRPSSPGTSGHRRSRSASCAGSCGRGTPPSLATALDAVAGADIDVKSGAADPAYAVERMVLQVAAARRT